MLRSVLRYGKKQFPVDENRRETYRQSLAPEHEPSVLSGLEGEWNQLMAVCNFEKFLVLRSKCGNWTANVLDDGTRVAMGMKIR